MSDLYLKTIIPLRDGTPAEVREMAFPDFINVVQKFVANLGPLINQDGKITLDLEKLVPIIASQHALAAWAMSKATNLAPEKIATLGTRDTLAILNSVVELNVSKEVIDLGKKFAGDLGEAFGLQKTPPAPASPLPAPSITS